MYANIQSIWNTPPTPPKPRHPEAPEAGEEVMYVDLSRDKLEKLYSNDKQVQKYLDYDKATFPPTGVSIQNTCGYFYCPGISSGVLIQ